MPETKSAYDRDPRVKVDTHHGKTAYTVTTEGGPYRILFTEAFNWTICHGPNLDFVQVAGGGFAIGISTADEAIKALIGPPKR